MICVVNHALIVDPLATCLVQSEERPSALLLQRKAAAICRGLAGAPAGDPSCFLALVIGLVVSDVTARERIDATRNVATNPGLVARLEARLTTADAAARGSGELGKLRGVRVRRQ